MDSNTNYLILDANNLTKTVDTKLELLKQNGFSEDINAKLKTDLKDLEEKEAAQSKAVQDAQKKTAEQDQTMEGVYSLIKRVRNTARTAFEGDETMLNQFRTSEAIPSTIKNLRSLCEYLSPLVVIESAVMLKNGLMQEDIDNLQIASARILAADSEQEQAKKVKEAATITRNNAAKQLTKQMKKIRTFIKARFDKQPEIKVLFNPVPKGRGGGNGKEEEVKVQAPAAS